ncbi:MAG: hypothetical protein IT451_07055 [Candidatus Brocadia sp.]|nr:hypothetical protein [Candidatus Brocadia sp.]
MKRKEIKIVTHTAMKLLTPDILTIVPGMGNFNAAHLLRNVLSQFA